VPVWSQRSASPSEKYRYATRRSSVRSKSMVASIGCPSRMKKVPPGRSSEATVVAHAVRSGSQQMVPMLV
jgi:hypothetical protein